MSPTPSKEDNHEPLVLHATTVVLAGRAALFRGPSASGKSGLALQLIALGASLVSDDRTQLTRQGARLLATAPTTLNNKIEARYVGILKVPNAASAPLSLIVDMAQEETDRLPVPRFETLLGLSIPIIRKSTAPYFPAALALYLQGERLE